MQELYDQATYRTKLISVFEELEGKLIEREQIIRLVVLAMFSKHHVFLIGTPGVAKTRLLKIIATMFMDGSFWEILMTKETGEKHLLGETISDDSIDRVIDFIDHESVAKFQQGCENKTLNTILSFFKIGLKRTQKDNIEDLKKKASMIYHHFLLFDEMFKAKDDLLVSLLSMLNERYYTAKGKAIPVPLISMFSASNELPTGEKIEPFVDRILIWYKVERIQEKENFARYVKGLFDKDPNTKIKFSLEELEYCFMSASAVEIPENILALYAELEHNINNAGIKVSNRKFGPDYIIRALKTSAWLNNRNYLNESDLLLIEHMAWQDFTEKQRLTETIHDTVFGNSAEVAKKVNLIIKLYGEKDGEYNNMYASTVAFNEDFSGKDYGKFNKNLQGIIEYGNNLIDYTKQMEAIYQRYHLFSNYVLGLVEENIFVHRYKVTTFEKQEELLEIEHFITDRKNDIAMLNDWVKNNQSMADFQQNKNAKLGFY